MAKLYAIYEADGRLRLSETESNSGDPTFIGPYIASNKSILAQWCWPGDTVEHVRIEREADGSTH